MKRTRYTESQIVDILKEGEAGASLEDLSRQHEFSNTAGTASGLGVSTVN